MRVTIVGQGAIGLLWYSHLVNHCEVSLKTSERATAFSTYSFTHFDGASQTITVKLANEASLAQSELVLLCVKSYQVANTLKQLWTQIPHDCVVILCHNGLGTLSELPKSMLEKHSYLTLLLTHGSLKITAKHIQHTGFGESFVGLQHGKITIEKRNAIINLLNSALTPVTWLENIAVMQWQKLIVNCVINPLTALSGETNRYILSDKLTLSIKMIIDEIIAVAHCVKIKIEANKAFELVLNVANKTANNKSSMLQDVLTKQTTEIDYINGYIVKLGLKHHIDTPQNLELVKQIKQLNSSI